MRLLRDWRIGLGVALGLVVATGICAVQRRLGSSPTGRLLSDCSGAIREVVIQYMPGTAATVGETHRQFLSQLDAGVIVRVVCPDKAAFDEFAAAIGKVPCRLEPVCAGHEMTGWSRDRWIALAPPAPGGKTILVSPVIEAATAVWPARHGDARIGDDLAKAVPGVISRRSTLAFDGGDFVCDGETAFVATPVIARNLQKSAATLHELHRLLERETGMRVVLLENSPSHHAGMFMMCLGGRRVIVGDPSLARGILGEGAQTAGLCGEAGADFGEEIQAKFDSVAAQCEEAGYRVIRMPLVPGRDGRTWLTWLNVILDERDGSRTVFMPAYAHVPALNESAAAVWQAEGFEVRPVDCSSVYCHFGALRCLVNVLRRAAQG